MGTFASQAAIAIGNARAYQQIQRYASTVAE
jgi:GAF domain-containing protein